MILASLISSWLSRPLVITPGMVIFVAIMFFLFDDDD
jgi:hypothetical protein